MVIHKDEILCIPRMFLKTVKDISYIKWNNKEGIYSFYIINDANTDNGVC